MGGSIKHHPDTGHFEGRKYWCDCRTRKWRLWLGIKRYGVVTLEEEPYY